MIKNFNLSESNVDNFIAKLKALDLQNVRYVATVIEKKTSRSLEQNARLWKLYTELGNYIGHTPDEVHTLMGWKFLRTQDYIHGELVDVIKSTTKLDTKQMTDYQNSIEQWAGEIGFAFYEA
jgi:hypothetical protein